MISLETPQRKWASSRLEVGRLPSLVTSTLTGAAAGVQNYLLSGISLAVTAVITVMGILYYRRICKQEKEAQEAAK